MNVYLGGTFCLLNKLMYLSRCKLGVSVFPHFSFTSEEILIKVCVTHYSNCYTPLSFNIYIELVAF